MMRDQILDVAQQLVLEYSFEAITIEDVLATANVSLDEFHKYFKSKNQLAMALVTRFSQVDNQLLDDALARAELASNDPLQQLLFVIDKLVDLFDALTEPYPGCVFASYVYGQEKQDTDTLRIIKDGLLYWREKLQHKLNDVQQKYPAQTEISTADLADQITVILEGAFIMAKSLHEPALIANQLRLYRKFIECLFER